MEKKTIIEINSCEIGSTGTIMKEIACAARLNGYCCLTSSPKTRKRNRNNENHLYYGFLIEKKINNILEKLTGFTGCFSIIGTYLFIKKLDKIKPDIIHLHNLHSAFLSIPMLFKYIKKKNIAVVWTLHDCWSFTGRCPHFQILKCDRWKEHCSHCQYPLKDYPSTYVNQAYLMWKLKRKWFTGVKQLCIITPSLWLKRLVKESYLKEYKVKVINNGINLGMFHPTNREFRNKYGIKADEYVVLGVAWPWSKKKGLDVFAELSTKLRKEYRIVLVGIEPEDKITLPENIICIERVYEPRELASIYSSADVFVNPTREEVLGLVNIESLACGTPVITFDSGGSPECIDDSCGCVVQKDNLDDLITRITYVCEEKPFTIDTCVRRAYYFDSKKVYQQYIELYADV